LPQLPGGAGLRLGLKGARGSGPCVSPKNLLGIPSRRIAAGQRYRGRNGQKCPRAFDGYRQGLTETIVGQEAIDRFRAAEGRVQSVPGDYFAELAAIAQDPALGVQNG